MLACLPSHFEQFFAYYHPPLLTSLFQSEAREAGVKWRFNQNDQGKRNFRGIRGKGKFGGIRAKARVTQELAKIGD